MKPYLTPAQCSDAIARETAQCVDALYRLLPIPPEIVPGTDFSNFSTPTLSFLCTHIKEGPLVVRYSSKAFHTMCAIRPDERFSLTRVLRRDWWIHGDDAVLGYFRNQTWHGQTHWPRKTEGRLYDWWRFPDWKWETANIRLGMEFYDWQRSMRKAPDTAWLGAGVSTMAAMCI